MSGRTAVDELARLARTHGATVARRARERVGNVVGAVKCRVTWLVDVKRIAESRPIRRRVKG
jgi:hypothetical protein